MNLLHQVYIKYGKMSGIIVPILNALPIKPRLGTGILSKKHNVLYHSVTFHAFDTWETFHAVTGPQSQRDHFPNFKSSPYQATPGDRDPVQEAQRTVSFCNFPCF